MKINLLTIHWGRSYGAVLQTYATTKILEELGHEVYVINLHPTFENKTKYKEFSLFLNYLSFKRFKRRYIPNLGLKTCSLNDISLPEADVTIVGSDQVWNHDVTKDLGLQYYLPFCKGKRVSLSSSFGKATWTESPEYTSMVASELKKFSAISVREDSGIAILNNIFNITNAVKTLDPTLIYGRFENLVRNTNPRSTIFTYLFNEDANSRNICKIVSESLGYEIYKYNHITSRTKRGPLDWLEQIHNSPFVITNSFHGMSFSLLFRKKFIILCADEHKFTRLESLLHLIGLEDRIVKSQTDLERRISILKQEIDYTMIESILADERQKSIDYIIESLNDNNYE